MERRLDVESELRSITDSFKDQDTFTFKEVRAISGMFNYDSERKWAAYRLKELIKMGKVKKFKRGLYTVLSQ
jgi:hypothetical protein